MVILYTDMKLGQNLGTIFFSESFGNDKSYLGLQRNPYPNNQGPFKSLKSALS